MVLARLDEQVALDGRVYALTTNEWASGAVTPGGYTLLESLHLEGSVPIFTYALADALLQKRNWMAYGANTTYVTYCLVRACRPARLTLTPIGGFRDYHSHNIGAEERPAVQLAENGVRVTYADRTPYWPKINRGTFRPEPTWYWDFYHRVEAYRGLDTNGDLFSPGLFCAELAPGDPLTFVVSQHKRQRWTGRKPIGPNGHARLRSSRRPT